MKSIRNTSASGHRKGFSLVEVVLAIGVISVAILAMLGMFAPSLKTISDIIDSEDVLSVKWHTANLLATETTVETAPGQDDLNVLTPATVQRAMNQTSEANSVFYCWVEVATDDTIARRYFMSKSDAEGAMDLALLEGTVYAVVLQKAKVEPLAPNGFWEGYTNLNNQARMPVEVVIMRIDPELAFNKSVSFAFSNGVFDINSNAIRNIDPSDVLLTYVDWRDR